MFVTGHAKSQTEDGTAVLLDEQSKRFAVPRLRPLDRAAGLGFHPSFRLWDCLTVRRPYGTVAPGTPREPLLRGMHLRKWTVFLFAPRISMAAGSSKRQAR